MIKKFYLRIVFILIIFSTLQCSSNKKEFTIWIGGAPQELSFWQSVVNDFQKESGYKVQLVRQPTYSDQRRQSLIISLQAEQPNPDVFLMDIIWINQFIKSGWLVPLDSLVKKNNFPTELFFPKVLDPVDKLNGILYTLPVSMDMGFLYYRKDLLSQFGYNSPPQIWNELVEQSEKIQKAERKGNSNFNGFVWQGAQYEGLTCTFLEFIKSNGGRLMKDGKVDVTGKKNLEALTFMRDLIHKYHISPPNIYTEMKEEEVRRAFQSGNALFERNWPYAWALHQEKDSKVRGKVGITKLPHFEGDSSASALGGWFIAISKYSDVKGEAWEFVKYVTSFKIQKKMFEVMGYNPGRSDIYKDEDLLKKYPRLEVLYEVLKSAVLRPTIPYYPQVSDVIQRYVNDCLAGKISPADALKGMQSEINDISKLYEK